MEVIYLNEQKRKMSEPICSAVGFFDGLHIGHMALVDEVLRISERTGYKKALMTFDHHPQYVLGYVDDEKYLTSMDDRISLLEEKGIDYLFVITFTKDVASLSPEQFIRDYIVSNHIDYLVCGFDYRFGKKNQGTVQTLLDYPNLDVSIISEQIYENEKISSSRIRRELEKGHVEDIEKLLGRYYTIKGTVIHGRRIGHTIGFPTANIDYKNYFLPQRGVYVVKVYIDKKEYTGMCNIGFNPTFTALNKASVEVHILDFDKDIYGHEISVSFYKMIRGEKHFSSPEEIIQQLHTDKEYVAHYF